MVEISEKIRQAVGIEETAVDGAREPTDTADDADTDALELDR